jgi:hypothetical protein
LASTLLASICGSVPNHVANARADRGESAAIAEQAEPSAFPNESSSTTPITAEANASAPGVPRATPGDLPFVEWLATHCFVDRLAPSHYTTAWLKQQGTVRRPVDADSVLPIEDGKVMRAPGSAGSAERAARLRQELRDGKSHVVDCRLEVSTPRCPTCPDKEIVHTHYTAYLPAALFSRPEQVRSVLLLVPGGRGGRSRWFLSPIPGKGLFDSGSGGLRTKQRVDAYLAAHPDSTPPIAVALETRGAELNGAMNHLTRDIPRHVIETYLPGVPAEQIVFGAEGTSSGARAILEVLWQRPDAFATVGLTAAACGAIDPENEDGPSRGELEAWAATLADRHQRGSFHMRFAIGSHDPALPCSRSLHDLLLGAKMFDAIVPRLSNCAANKRPSDRSCDVELDGFVQYAGGTHNYGVLALGYAAQLDWHLAALDKAVRANARR